MPKSTDGDTISGLECLLIGMLASKSFACNTDLVGSASFISSFTVRNHLTFTFTPLPSGRLCLLFLRGSASGGPIEADREAEALAVHNTTDNHIGSCSERGSPRPGT